MKKINILLAATVATAAIGLSSCSDDYMSDLNVDKTKAETLNPNNQLTTALLQTYGDFQMMDTYRCYVTAFNQHVAGGWNVSNYGGAVNASDDMMRSIWDEYYNVGIKNLVDAIGRTGDASTANVNAILRISRVYIMSVLTDTYGDVPCSEAGLGYLEHISNPKYDTQEEIYKWFFTELEACIKQLGTGEDKVTGDVTAYDGNVDMWKKFANSLRMRYAMRISDVEPELAKSEFEKAVNDSCGYLTADDVNAYVIYTDSPFTLYDGARDLDFRVNALGETFYGQDATSPTMISATFYEMMRKNSDPRLNIICRHYNNVKRAEAKADEDGSFDLTDEVNKFLASPTGQALEVWKTVDQTAGPVPEGAKNGDVVLTSSIACVPGAAWYSNAVANEDYKFGLTSQWIQISDDDIKTYVPTLWNAIEKDPAAGYNGNNYQNRMLRPALSVKLEKGNTPGMLMTNAEVQFLLAEAKLLGWQVPGSVEENYANGVRLAMKMINHSYDLNYGGKDLTISGDAIEDYIAANPVGTTFEEKKERINTEAWILHFLNPSEAWANLRRSDYPAIMKRSSYFIKDFPSDDTNLTTPVRLKYPTAEQTSNKVAWQDAVARMGGTDDWHHRVWWDKNDNTHFFKAIVKK